jgi:hypothetical protein
MVKGSSVNVHDAIIEDIEAEERSDDISDESDEDEMDEILLGGVQRMS